MKVLEAGDLRTTYESEVLEVFRRLHADGQAILMVTHDREVADAANRIVSMREGRIEDGWTPAKAPAADLVFRIPATE